MNDIVKIAVIVENAEKARRELQQVRKEAEGLNKASSKMTTANVAAGGRMLGLLNGVISAVSMGAGAFGALGGALAIVLASLGPLVLLFNTLKKIVDVATTAWDKFVRKLQPFVDKIMVKLQPAFDKLAVAFDSLFDTIGAWIITTLPLAVPVIDLLIRSFAFLVKALGKVTMFVAQMVDIMLALVPGMGGKSPLDLGKRVNESLKAFENAVPLPSKADIEAQKAREKTEEQIFKTSQKHSAGKGAFGNMFAAVGKIFEDNKKVADQIAKEEKAQLREEARVQREAERAEKERQREELRLLKEQERVAKSYMSALSKSEEFIRALLPKTFAQPAQPVNQGRDIGAGGYIQNKFRATNYEAQRLLDGALGYGH